MLVHLAVAVGGEPCEVAGAGYAPVEASGDLVVFPAAEANWGVVRAFAIDDGDWVPLAAGLLVQAGRWVRLDLATRALTIGDGAPPAADIPRGIAPSAGPTYTPSRPLPGRGRATLANWPRGRR